MISKSLAKTAMIVGSILAVIVLFQWIGYFSMPNDIRRYMGNMLLWSSIETLLSLFLIIFAVKKLK